MGFGKTNARQQPVLAGVRVTRSLYDTVIPPIQGRCRVPYSMIFTGNFQVHNVNSKKNKSVKKTGGVKSYSANFDFLVGFGPCIAVGTIWRNRTQFWNAFVGSQQFTPSGTSTDFSGNVSNSPGPFLNILAITVQRSYSVTFNDYGSPGPVTLSGNFQKPLYNANYTPLFVLKSGQGQDFCTYFGSDNPGQTSWSVHVEPAISNPVITVYYLYSPSGAPLGLGSQGTNLMLESQLGNGTEFNYPGGSSFQTIYPEFAGVSAANYDMGMGDMAPQDNLEWVGMNNLSPNGDASPADFILDIITSGNYWPYNPTSSSWAHGLSFLPENVGATYLYAPNILADPPSPAPSKRSATSSKPSLGLQAVRDYCNAYGIYISGAMDAQRSASDWIDELCEIANCVPVWNGSKLSFIPRCEVSAVGNGAIYTAPTASGPLYTIDDSVYIAKEGEDPVVVTRNDSEDPRAIPNLVPVQHKSRGSGFYSDITTTFRDDAAISLYGLVPGSSKNWPFVQDGATALKCVAPLVRRQQMVEPVVIKFKLPISHCLLDCYDLIALNESALGWNGYPVRLTKIEEDDQRVLSVEAEPFIYGAHAPSTQTPASTVSTGFGNSHNATVATLVNTPIIFEPVPQLSGGVEQLWFLVSDTDANYGGCDIYLSTDGGADYTLIGSLVGNSTMGAVYNSTYPSSPDPDATDTLYADLTESAGTLGTFTTAARDAFTPLCLVMPGGNATINGVSVPVPYELISYATATLQTGNKYALAPTIRRGVFSTPDVAHAVGQSFGYLGPGAIIFKYNLPPGLIGKTLYFKFAAFNQYGANAQDLSTVTAYSFTPTGIGQVSSTPTAALNYSLSPAVVLYQGQAGGWPGVATGSSSWTDVTKVYIPPFTVTWSDGVQANYAPTSPVAIPGTPPETIYGAIYDPGRTGSGPFTLSTTNYFGQAGYVSLGAIYIANETTGGAIGGGGGSNPYDIICYLNGAPTASFAMLRYVADRPITLPANLNGSEAVCLTAPTGAVALAVKRNGTQIGTINFAAGATSATFTFTAAVTLQAGDLLEIDAPASVDSTFATISITLSATR